MALKWAPRKRCSTAHWALLKKYSFYKDLSRLPKKRLPALRPADQQIKSKLKKVLFNRTPYLQRSWSHST